MVLALQIILAICFFVILFDYIMNVRKNHKGEFKGVPGKKWAWPTCAGNFR